MTTRVNPHLWETSSNKYVADIGLSLGQVKTLLKIVQPAIIESRKATGAGSGDMTETLSNIMTYLLEANKLLKDATNIRQQGRYNANHKNIQ